VSVLISCLAAYSLVRLRYLGRDWVGRLILFAYLTPSALLFIPLSVIIARLGLGNTLHGLIFVYLTFATPLSTWLLMGYFRSIPADLEEQAMVDGATRLVALFRVVLPLTAPGLIAVSVFTFTGAWNELLLALIFITSPDKRTVPVAVSYLITGDVFRWGLIMAGSVAAAIPVMVLYYLGQRFVVQGLAAGAVKG
jgi:multiple sugar transport system permease protein